MKQVILFVIILISASAKGQTLKELLYGGKLKSDSGTVVRQSDDRKSIIDSNAKKISDSIKAKQAAIAKDSAGKELSSQVDSENPDNDESKSDVEPAKDNNKIWKEFMDSFVETLNADVLPNKKIKSGTYYILVDYEIGLEGQVTINNIYPSPENKFLQEQIKERLTLAAPQLNPVLLSTGKPRKALKKYNFTLTKN